MARTKVTNRCGGSDRRHPRTMADTHCVRLADAEANEVEVLCLDGC